MAHTPEISVLTRDNLAHAFADDNGRLAQTSADATGMAVAAHQEIVPGRLTLPGLLAHTLEIDGSPENMRRFRDVLRAAFKDHRTFGVNVDPTRVRDRMQRAYNLHKWTAAGLLIGALGIEVPFAGPDEATLRAVPLAEAALADPATLARAGVYLGAVNDAVVAATSVGAPLGDKHRDAIRGIPSDVFPLTDVGETVRPADSARPILAQALGGVARDGLVAAGLSPDSIPGSTLLHNYQAPPTFELIFPPGVPA